MRYLFLTLLVWLLFTPAQAERAPRQTSLGTYYSVDPRFQTTIDQTIERVRKLVRAERARDKLVGFVSIPLSARGGGNLAINVEVSELVKKELERRFGPDHFFALAPGLIETSLPHLDGQRAGGGEYMYLWTQVLAGDDGLGQDFDMVYFVGPRDFAVYFGLTGQNDLGTLRAFLQKKAAADPAFAASVSTPEQRRAFLSYYGLRASVSFSDGAHDEWNLFRLVNHNRRKKFGIGWQLPLFFDGGQLPMGAAESSVSEGYELP